MSDGEIREFELSDGTRAKVPAQHMEKWMRRMEARGVDFKTVGAPVAEPAPEPAPIAAPHAEGKEPPEPVDNDNDGDAPQRVQPFGDWLGNAVERGAQSFQDSSIGAGLAGVGRVLTGGGADELAGTLAGAGRVAGDPEGMQRIYRRGGPVADQVQQVRETQDTQDARYPIPTAIGKGVGAGMLAAATTPYLTAAAPLAAATGTAALGMAQGAGESRAASPEQVLADSATGGTAALAGGALPYAAAPVMTLASKPVAAVGRWMADSPRVVAWRNANRAAAGGAYGGKLAQLEESDPGYIQRLGQFAEDYQLGKRGEPTRMGGATTGGVGGAILGYTTSDEDTTAGKLADAAKYGAGGAAAGAALKLPAPSGASVYRDNAKALLVKFGDEIGRTVDAVSSYGYGYPKAELRKKLLASNRKLPNPNTEEGIALRKTMRRKIKTSIDSLPDKLDARALHGLKKQYESLAEFEPNATPGEGAIAGAYRDLAKGPRSMLHKAMRKQALPEDEAAFFSSNDNLGFASDLAAQGNKRVAQEAGNQAVSLSAAASGSIPGAAALQAAKVYGRDMTADALSGVLSAGRSMARLPQRLQVGTEAAFPSAIGAVESPQSRVAVEKASGAFVPAHAYAQTDEQQPSTAPSFGDWFAVDAARTPSQRVELSRRIYTDPEFRARLRANAEGD